MTAAASEKAYSAEARLNAIAAQVYAAMYPVGGDTARTATAILDDPYLTVPVVAGNVYEIRANVRYAGGAAGSAGFLRWLWNHPGGDFMVSNVYVNTSGNVVQQANIGTTSGLGAFTAGVGTDQPWRADAIYFCTGTGPLTFQWGCVTNTGTNTHVKEGSYLIAAQIG